MISSGLGGVIFCTPTTVQSLLQLLLPHGQWMILQALPAPSPEPQDQENEDEAEAEVVADSDEDRTFGERIKHHLDRIEYHSQRIRDIMSEGEAQQPSGMMST
eukprot:3798279-Amphidinium_carterae.1